MGTVGRARRVRLPQPPHARPHRRRRSAHPARRGVPSQLGHAHARSAALQPGPIRARSDRKASVGRHDDVLHGWNTQSSSQWDGFRHVRNPVHGHYGGVPDEEHGMHHWASRGLVGRAVLVDVGRWRAAEGRPLEMDQPDAIMPDDILGTLEAQGAAIEPGDVLLMRTGWVGWYSSLDMDTRTRMSDRTQMAAPGLPPGEATARFLWDLHIAAIGADNPAVEIWPPGALLDPAVVVEIGADPSRMHETFVHTLLLPMLGLPLGEMWNLEPLADDCASDGRYECFFSSAPLNLQRRRVAAERIGDQVNAERATAPGREGGIHHRWRQRHRPRVGAVARRATAAPSRSPDAPRRSSRAAPTRCVPSRRLVWTCAPSPATSPMRPRCALQLRPPWKQSGGCTSRCSPRAQAPSARC